MLKKFLLLILGFLSFDLIIAQQEIDLNVPELPKINEQANNLDLDFLKEALERALSDSEELDPEMLLELEEALEEILDIVQEFKAKFENCLEKHPNISEVIAKIFEQVTQTAATN